MKNILLSEEEKKEQLEMLEKEGLRARIANLIQPACNIIEFNKLNIPVNETDIALAEKKIATILFLAEEVSKQKQQ